jgi:hypothetical protein
MDNISFGDYRRSLGLSRTNPKTDKEFSVPDHAERVYEIPTEIDVIEGGVKLEYISGKGHVYATYRWIGDMGWWRWESRNKPN